MARHNLKEDDEFINMIRSMAISRSPTHKRGTLAEALAFAQSLLHEHRHAPKAATPVSATSGGSGAPVSRLKAMCPHVEWHIDLDFARALKEYDARTCITQRMFVPPSFREIRQILNLAVVHSVASTLRLVTLDADETLYSDGGTLTVDSPMIPLITKLLRLGVFVAVVTAAGYPGHPEKFEVRMAGLLRALASAIECGADPKILEKFVIMGGECNYLLLARARIPSDGVSPVVYLEEVPDESWKHRRGVRWDHDEVKRLLDAAQVALGEIAARLGLNVKIIRKDRAVGMILDPAAAIVGAYGRGRLTYETLEEVALHVQHALSRAHFVIPHTCFNGGNDVWVDIGNKALGIRTVQSLVNASPAQTIHCGDRFTRTGNDYRARDVASALWVESPAETEYLLSLLIDDIRAARGHADEVHSPTPHALLPALTQPPTEVGSPTAPVQPAQQPAVSLFMPPMHAVRSPMIDPLTGIEVPEVLNLHTGEFPPSSSTLLSGRAADRRRSAQGAPEAGKLSAAPSTTSLDSMDSRSGPAHGVGSGGHAIHDVYGMTAERALREMPALTLANQRSRLEGSGGRVVTEIRRSLSPGIDNRDELPDSADATASDTGSQHWHASAARSTATNGADTRQ